jgi:MoaA/NifB/PqqE/SkfB family radical SAM enzyme
VIKLHEIEQVQIELTTRCNARCPMCIRNYRGYEHNDGYPETELRLDDIKKIFSPEIIKQLKRVQFNGNLGDFGLAKDGIEIVKYFVEHGIPEIDVSTNGSMRTPEWWAQLALPNVSVGFALDGLEDTHHLYRQDTDWHKIIENAKGLIAAGGNAVWRFIPFDHNRHQESACYHLSKELGFIDFQNIGHGRDRTQVYTRTGEYSHIIGAPYKPNDITHPPTIQSLLKHHYTWYSPKTVRVDADQPELKLECFHKTAKEVYIAADGSVYPCCYLGFYPDAMFHPGNDQLKELVYENNAVKYGLEHAMRWFEGVETSWKKKSIADGRLFICVDTCGKCSQ